MKIFKDVGPLFLVVAIVFCYSSCAKKKTSFVEEQSDGYVFTANEESFKNVRENSSYLITFIDAGGQKTLDRDAVKAALGDATKYCSIQGTASKIGNNQLKITTGSKITVDLARPFATFWGIDSKRLRELVTSTAPATESCGTCGGIPDMVQVTCQEPTSVLCCTTCK